MQHVDEGALHAYLDGALDEYPLEEAARIRAHLVECRECADRLEEEARVREEAGRVLGMVAPAVDAPPLEELRARARARGVQRRSLGRLQRLGWAASVVLALGTGWLLRGVQPPRPGPVESPAQAQEAERGIAQDEAAASALEQGGAGAPVADADAGRAAGTSGGPRGGAASRPAGSGQDATGALRADSMEAGSTGGSIPVEGAAATAPPPVPDARERVAEADAAPNPAAVTSAAVPPPPESVAGAGAARPTVVVPNVLPTTQEPPVELRALEPTAARRAAEMERLRGPVSRAAAPDAAPAAPETMMEDRAEAKVASSLVVPGLEVLSVSWLEGAAPGTVRALQRLESGDTLEVLHLPAGSDPSALGPREADGRAELVQPRADGGYLVLRAAVDAETLARLAALIGGDR